VEATGRPRYSFEYAAELLPFRRLHLAKIGVNLTELRRDQADYIGVKPEGPYKSDHYRY